MIGFKQRHHIVSLLLGFATASACQMQHIPSSIGRPEYVTVRLDGSTVEASLDGVKFVPWSMIEAGLREDGPGSVVRLSAENTTVGSLLAWIHKLRQLNGQVIVTLQLSQADPDTGAVEIGVTDSLHRFLEHDRSGCAQIEALYDGRRFMVRIRDTTPRQSRPRPPAFRSAADALLVSITDQIWYSTRLPPTGETGISCDGFISSDQCENVLDQSLDTILRIGLPCGKAFAYAPAELDWSRFAVVLKSLTEIGAEEVLIKIEGNADLWTELNNRED